MARSKVKSRSDHDAAYLHPLTNVPTKYQLPKPYGFRDIALTRFYRSRSLRQGQRSNQGHTMTVTYIGHYISTLYITYIKHYISALFNLSFMFIHCHKR